MVGRELWDYFGLIDLVDRGETFKMDPVCDYHARHGRGGGWRGLLVVGAELSRSLASKGAFPCQRSGRSFNPL